MKGLAEALRAGDEFWRGDGWWTVTTPPVIEHPSISAPVVRLRCTDPDGTAWEFTLPTDQRVVIVDRQSSTTGASTLRRPIDPVEEAAGWRFVADVLAAELAHHGHGDFHYGPSPRDPGVVSALEIHAAATQAVDG